MFNADPRGRQLRLFVSDPREHRRRSLPGDSRIILNGFCSHTHLAGGRGSSGGTLRPCRLETASTEFPYFPLCAKRPATVKSRVKIRRYTPYRAIRFENRAVRVATKKRNEKGRRRRCRNRARSKGFVVRKLHVTSDATAVHF